MPQYSGGWRKGDYLAICDRCGFKYLRSRMRMEWENWLVCLNCWEPRHPQDITPPSRVDVQWVPEPRDRRLINNFSGWFITDGNDIIEKNGDNFNAYFSIDGEFETASHSAYADYGAGYFDGDFELRFRYREFLDSGIDLRTQIGLYEDIVNGDSITSTYALLVNMETDIQNRLATIFRDVKLGSSWFTNLPQQADLINKTVGVLLKRKGNDITLSLYDNEFFRDTPRATATVALQGDTGRVYRYLYAVNSVSLGGASDKIADIQFIQVELR